MSHTPPKIGHSSSNVHLWWMTAVLMTINIGLFLWQISTGVDSAHPSHVDALAWGADYAPLTFLYEPYRLFSSMFFHFGMIHLMLNMWALYIFGSVSEQIFGRVYFSIVYLLAGLSGSLLSAYLDVQNSLEILQSGMLLPELLPRVSAGASGAVMGLGGALTLLSLLPILKTQQFILDKKSLVFIMGLNLFIGVMTTGINNAAHVGGMLMGALLALIWYVSEKYQTTWLKWLGLFSTALFLIFVYQYAMSLVHILTPLWQELLAVMQQQLKT